MKKLSIVSIVLILAFLLIPSQTVMGQMMKQGEFNKGDRHEMMIKKLQLTEEQQEAIQDLRFNHQNDMIDLKADVQKKKLQLEELKSSGNYTREEFLASVEALSNAKQKVAIAKANHRMDVYELLTDEQRKTFDKMGNRMDNRREHFREKRFRRGF